MKTIKLFTAVLFTVLMAGLISQATGVNPYAIIAVLLVGSVALSLGMAKQGILGEFLTIEATDSNETKAAKETFNRIHTDLESKSNKGRDELKAELALQIKGAIDQNSELKGQVTELLAQEAELKSKLSEQQEAILEINRFRSAAQAQQAKGKTFTDALNEAIDDNSDNIKAFAAKKEKKVTFELKAVGDMGLSSIANLTAANVQVAPGIVPLANRQVHMRDVLPSGRMTTTIYNFLKEIGFDGSLGAWQENSGAKPQVDITYAEETAPSQYIAGYLRISRKALDDIPALKASIANRLLQKYLDAEDAGILQGTGANGQLSGLYQSGNSIAYTGTFTKSIEMIIDAQSVIEEFNHNSTGMIMRPSAYNYLMLSHSTGNTNGIYSLPGLGTVMMVNGQMYINGVPTWKTTAMVQNSFLLGDFDMATMIMLREDPIVEFFEQDADNVTKNQITVRCEGRIALPNFYNDALIHGTFVNPGS